MRSQKLIWIFAGAFVLFGVTLFFVEDEAARDFWGGLSILCLGGFALALAYDALATGRITIQFSKISRRTQPRMFWAAVGLVVATGSVVIVAGLRFIFFGR